jgi:hypothetical protein
MTAAYRLTACDIEIAVAAHFNARMHLIVPNVSWGLGLRHEADMLIVSKSGYCDEIEIKVTASDIKADLGKRYDHWEDPRIARVWFAVPAALKDCPHIPQRAGILSVRRCAWRVDAEGVGAWRDWMPEDGGYTDFVDVVRPAALRDKATRRKLSDADRLRLAELGAMRVWALKSALLRAKQRRYATTTTKETP